jgi:hypothetical protein
MAKSTRIKAGAGEGAIRVVGVTELAASLKALEPALAKGLRVANKLAATTVRDAAKSKASGLGGVAAHVAPSITASAGLKSASVGLGGAAFPMAAGAEFGGRGRPTTQQFQQWRGTQGIFLFPTIRKEGPAITEEYLKTFDVISREVGLR